MNNKSHLDDDERRKILGELTLSLASDEMPFALLDSERDVGPDNWAWMFLRLNKEYRNAYFEQEQNAEEDPDIQSFLVQPGNRHIKTDRDGTCKSRFGLSAWLNPNEPNLPLLKNKGSWFFHLKRPVSEDYRRTEINEGEYVKRSGPPLPGRPSYPHLESNETPLGYLTTHTLPRAIPGIRCDWGLTWVAVDCSVPPEGQVSALRTLAESNRAYLAKDWGFKTHDAAKSIVENLEDSDAFINMRFGTSRAGLHSAYDQGILWRAVCVDCLGPIVSQIDDCLSTLKEVHQRLVDSKLVTVPPFRRLPHELPGEKDKDGELRSGGNYLKALLMIAELAPNYETNEIAEITGTHPRLGRYSHAWQELFHNSIDRYRDEALSLINDGYKWLIHYQKPDSKITPPQ